MGALMGEVDCGPVRGMRIQSKEAMVETVASLV